MKIGALVLWAALALGAADWTALKPEGYVSDFAGVLRPEQKAQLNDYLGRVEAGTKAQIAIVTIATLEGEPAEDVANLLMRTWGIGQKSENNGALFLLSINDRKSRLEVGYGLEPILPDGFAGGLLREMRPALREQRYAEALLTAATEIGTRVAREKGVTIPDTPRRTKREDSGKKGFPIGFLVTGALLFFLLSRGGGGRGRGGMGGGLLPGILLGTLLNSGGRSHGGGGFGGYDSGGGFGGFGGGDSGGGGASSDW